ncbi:MAG TPA: rRNA maturation RNase YbeY, partial [Candidatus Limnocylindrales bacterium]|nr:rRNA maturation RNase YbeY [Candidatus Limnocylindrales bacterium]
MAAHRIAAWRIDIERRDGVPRVVADAELARVTARALDAAGAPGPASIGLVLTHDEELAQLNVEHMGRRGPTDVLSFPLLPPGAFPPHPGQSGASGASGVPGGPAASWAVPFALPPGRRPHLGDIVVSVERAIEQAEEGRGGHTGD